MDPLMGRGQSRSLSLVATALSIPPLIAVDPGVTWRVTSIESIVVTSATVGARAIMAVIQDETSALCCRFVPLFLQATALTVLYTIGTVTTGAQFVAGTPQNFWSPKLGELWLTEGQKIIIQDLNAISGTDTATMTIFVEEYIEGQAQ